MYWKQIFAFVGHTAQVDKPNATQIVMYVAPFHILPHSSLLFPYTPVFIRIKICLFYNRGE